jgi:uncharacterized membrane-anchored protein
VYAGNQSGCVQVPARTLPGMETTTRTLIKPMLNKVPEVTVLFWVVKIVSTTVGETAADFLAGNLGLGLTTTSLLMAALLAVALVVQLRSRRYVPIVYWVAVVLVSIVGTLISHNLVDNFGVSLWTTTALFSVALAATFLAWWRSEHTLSIHTIINTRRETFYWLAILFTFALGTSAGDLVSEQLGLGYVTSAAIVALLIGLVTIAYDNGVNAVLTFWTAYVLTRTFGASIGDLLTAAHAHGGLGLGTNGTSALFLAVILGAVGWMSVTHTPEPALIPIEED